jgi:F-type H+-transporting ATPase subunit b
VDLLSINSGMVVWSVIVFLLLLVILGKFAWKPLLTAIDEREKGIKDAQDAAENAQKNAEEKLAQLNSRLEKAQNEAENILSTAKTQAEKTAEMLKKEAGEEAQKMLDTAKKTIEAEKQHAFNELRKEVAELAVGAANKIIKANLDAGKQQELVDHYIKEMPNKLN